MSLDRRSFLRGLIAAPAVVAAAHIMQVRVPAILRPSILTLEDFPSIVVSNRLLPRLMLTREAVRMFRDSNRFIRNIEAQYRDDFNFMSGDAANSWQWPAKIGSELRIRLPKNWEVENVGT